MSILSGTGEYLPVERAALIAVALRNGAFLTTEDLCAKFGITKNAAKRDFQRLQRVLPIIYRPYPEDNRFKQWFWTGKEIW